MRVPASNVADARSGRWRRGEEGRESGHDGVGRNCDAERRVGHAPLANVAAKRLAGATDGGWGRPLRGAQGVSCGGRQMAERGGFEPPSPVSRTNGFRDRRIQPLCHLSARRCSGPRAGGLASPRISRPSPEWGSGGEGGIRTLEAGHPRPRDFQSRSLSQLGHLSVVPRGVRPESGRTVYDRGWDRCTGAGGHSFSAIPAMNSASASTQRSTSARSTLSFGAWILHRGSSQPQRIISAAGCAARKAATSGIEPPSP